MRVILLIITILPSLTISVMGQVPCEEGKTISVNEQGDSIVTYVEKPAYLKEGFEPYMKWIQSNRNKRLEKKKKEVKKTVYIAFLVHEDGTRTDFEIRKGVGEPYDSEALRLVRDNPQEWVAGQCGKKKITTRTIMPVKF